MASLFGGDHSFSHSGDHGGVNGHADNHSFGFEGHGNQHTDNGGTMTYGGSVSGDYHGHTSYGGTIDYSHNGFDIGAGVSVGPNHDMSVGGSVGITW